MPYQTIKKTIECDECEGQGSYQFNGEYLPCRCDKCGGTGEIETEEEIKIRHKWEKLPREGWKEVAECTLCGCKRFISNNRDHNGQMFSIVQYDRSGILTDKIAPECWGAKTPQ